MSVMTYQRRTLLLPAFVAAKGVVRLSASPDIADATSRGRRP